MATLARDEIKSVTDDNISAQVQSKVKLQATKEFQVCIENDGNDIELLRQMLSKLITKKNEIARKARRDIDISELDQLFEVDERIDKVNIKILSLEKKLLSIDSDEDQHSLHERNDSTGTYYLFNTKSVKNKKYYPKDCILNYKLKDKENIPTLLNKFDELLRRHDFDNVFSSEIKNIDPRENQILCKILNEAIHNEIDIVNTTSENIFLIIDKLQAQYRSSHGRQARIKAWNKIMVDRKCKKLESLRTELNKLVLMERCILPKCYDNNETRDYILKENLLDVLHESLKMPVYQRLFSIQNEQKLRVEEYIINIIIQTINELGVNVTDQYEMHCKYCKSEFHSSINCRMKLDKKHRSNTNSYLKGNVSQGTTKKNTPKLVQNQPEPLKRQQKKRNKKGSDKNLVIIGTGSGISITNNKNLLHNYEDNQENTQLFGIGKTNPVSVKGSGYIKIKSNTNDNYLLAHYVPEEETTIISGYELAKETDLVLTKNYLTLGNKDMNIKTQVKNGIIYVKINDLIDHPAYDFKRNTIQPKSSPKTRLMPRIISLEDAHKRMGHTGVQQIENSIKHSQYEESIDLIKEPNEFWCETCKVSKITRRNHYAGSMNEHSIDHEPGSSWCMDILGPVSNSNSGIKRYMFIMVDNNTRYCMTSTHFNKSAETILAQIKKNIQYVETQFDRKVREINSDRGTEFTNDQIAEYFVSKGIHHIFSGTQDHAANGRAERYIRTIITDAITLLRQSNLCIRFWEYAVNSATDVRNCLENHSTGQLPLKAISGQPVKVRFMSFLPFGEQGIILNHKYSKLKQPGLSAIILCKDPNRHGYKLFVPSTKKIVTSSNYTLSNYAKDPILRNTQNIYLDDQSRSDTFNEAENLDAVSRLYNALENYEDCASKNAVIIDNEAILLKECKKNQR
ncbi:integrase catalytic domain-containing protein DI49_2906 [Saccharomyces eubayanus]|uniref:integrase catalytic domain-containing protein n=1 Tax=Saccharomyces eubayanus TaxID=1080349 RepID=UPI0006BFF621|nr:hypothetical protein DI49_2906 [Saccharomyces eubayanus]KOG98498.1 hypothetical protein DI49_2906 [Saccharomyces eubayanus]